MISKHLNLLLMMMLRVFLHISDFSDHFLSELEVAAGGRGLVWTTDEDSFETILYVETMARKTLETVEMIADDLDDVIDEAVEEPGN